VKREKQILISKNLIKDALFEILMEKDFRDITISEITCRAKVGRMTFYRNFSRKEEIVVFFFQGLLSQILEDVHKLQAPTAQDILLVRFRVIRGNPIINQLVGRDGIQELLEEFREMHIGSFREFLPPQGKYALAYKMGGLLAVTEAWMQSGMRESPEEITGRIMNLMGL